MSSRGWPSLEIERSGRTQTVVASSVLGVFAVVPNLANLPTMVTAAVLVTSLAIGALALWHIGWLGGDRAVVRARWTHEGTWYVWGADGASSEAFLSSSSRAAGRLVWLRFRTAIGHRHLLFWGDDLPADIRRRLVARLRVQGAVSERCTPESEAHAPQGRAGG